MATILTSFADFEFCARGPEGNHNYLKDAVSLSYVLTIYIF